MYRVKNQMLFQTLFLNILNVYSVLNIYEFIKTLGKFNLQNVLSLKVNNLRMCNHIVDINNIFIIFIPTWIDKTLTKTENKHGTFY